MRADLLIKAWWTAIEADGKVKYVGATAHPEQSWKDKLRRDRARELGWEMQRFVAAD